MSLPNDKKTGRARTQKNVLMLIVAVGLGSGGVYLANDLIQSKVAEYKSRLEGKQKMVELVVPKRDLPRGTRLIAADLATRQIPVDFAHNGTVTASSYKRALGQRVAFSAEKGKPLLWAHLEGGETPTFSGNVPEGMRALTVPVDKVSAISGFLQPKDKIDLLLTYRPRKEEVTIPLLQNVVVLATGTKTVLDKKMGAGSKPTTYNTVTLQVAPRDAKKIILAQETGKLTAVLRHPDDEGNLSKDPMTVAKLVDRPVVKRQRRAPRIEKPKGVEFIIGGI